MSNNDLHALHDTIEQQQAEIERLLADLTECRRLLRDAAVRDGFVDQRWFDEAKQAAGGKDE